MVPSIRIGLLLALLGLLPATSARGQTPEDAVKLKVVKYADLADAVRQQKGKVVVVDFWADF